MARFELMVGCAALAIALSPLTALAADTSNEHMQSELANAQSRNRGLV